MSKQPLVLILGTAEWDAPIATNQHYVTRELAVEFDVLFTEGMGTRRPSPSRSDLRRVAGRLTGGRNVDVSNKRPVPPRVTLTSPLVVPFHSRTLHGLNTRLLARSVRQWLDHDGPRVLWTYTPYTYDLERNANFTVFHLVDLIHKNPGVSEKAFVAAEQRLARRTDLALCTSEPIAEHLRSVGFTDIEVKGNVADVAVFASAAPAPQGSELPVVVFAGNLRNDKLDVGLLTTLAKELQGTAQLRLIGPSDLNGDGSWLDSLRALGVDVKPAMPLDRLASEIAASKVGIIPYAITELTRGISPLKTYEYLAAGVPVVTTALPSMKPVDGLIHVAQDDAAFVAAVKTALSTTARNAHTYVAQHSWLERGKDLRAYLMRAVGRSVLQ